MFAITSFTLLVLAQAIPTQQAYLKAHNSGQADQFGDAIAIDGSVAVVGAKAQGAPFGPGAVYVYEHDGSNWSQQAFLMASNPDTHDVFGVTVDISGDTIVVGAQGEDSAATGVNGDQSDNTTSSAGAAYVFVRQGTDWVQQAYLKAAATDPFDTFGQSLAISGDTIVVGAGGDDSNSIGVNGDPGNNGTSDSGAVYVFVRSGSTWTQQAYLKASNAESEDYFGGSVDISGDTILVSAQGEDSGSTGINGDQGDNSEFTAGAAYVFVRSGTSWSQQAYLKASNTGIADGFGEVVSIDGDTAAVSACGEDTSGGGVNPPEDNQLSFSGAVYVYSRVGTTWSQQAFLKAFLAQPDGYGTAMSISGDHLLVAANVEDGGSTGVGGDLFDNSAPGAGAAYLYVRNGTAWAEGGYFKASNTGSSDLFGVSVAASDQWLAMGAPGEASGANTVNGNQADNGFPSTGAAYVFDLGDPPFVYCTGKASSAACSASIAGSNPAYLPRSGAADYYVQAAQVQELKNGLLFAGLSGAAALPFNGGTLCVQPPTKRGPIMSSGGSNQGGCDGSFSTLVNDGNLVPFGLDAGPGETAWYQYWYRDPQNGPGQLGTALSDAVALTFL